MPKHAPRKTSPAPASTANTLVSRLQPGQTPETAIAQMVVAGLASNTVSTVAFAKYPFGEVDVTECLNALVDAAERVNKGDLGDAEALLLAQAVTLNTIFIHLAHRAQLNMGEYLDTTDRYLRLALKAQSQCRATLETLAVIKNPPTVFARQANIAHGPQQINNAVPPQSLATPPRAANLDSEPNELLEAHGERLDGGAAGATRAGDQAMASVGTLDRTTNG